MHTSGESSFERDRAAFLEAYPSYEDFGRCLDGGESPGAVRISFGLASTFADAHACVRFLRRFLQ